MRLDHVVLTAMSALLLSGCGLVLSYPNDIRLLSLTVVDRRVETQVPGRYDKEGRLERPDEPALKVAFTSRVNLIEAGWGTAIGAGARFCDHQDQLPSFVGSPAPNLAWRDVFAGDLDVSKVVDQSIWNSQPAKIPASMAQTTDGSYIYHAYIIIKTGTYTSWKPEQTWDLETMPHDVCLTIGTGNYITNFTSSNRLRLSEELIRAVFAGVAGH